jgi:hypothetical protein
MRTDDAKPPMKRLLAAFKKFYRGDAGGVDWRANQRAALQEWLTFGLAGEELTLDNCETVCKEAWQYFREQRDFFTAEQMIGCLNYGGIAWMRKQLKDDMAQGHLAGKLTPENLPRLSVKSWVHFRDRSDYFTAKQMMSFLNHGGKAWMRKQPCDIQDNEGEEWKGGET